MNDVSSLNLCKVDTPFCKYCGTKILKYEVIFMAYDRSFLFSYSQKYVDDN
jgi:hypothetical protein